MRFARVIPLVAAAFGAVVIAVGKPGPSEDFSTPIRPGVPGEKPFWNGYTKRFIWAPAFDLPEAPGATGYRFEIAMTEGGARFTFSAPKPWTPLSPVWNDLPEGGGEVTVVALGLADEPVVGKRDFVKSPPFRGVTNKPAYRYDESALRCLTDLFHQEKVNSWLTSGNPDVSYPKWVYPSKTGWATISGMVGLAQRTVDPQTRAKALTIARRTADFLLQLRFPATAPLGGLFPTYWNGAVKDINPSYPDRIMMPEPTRVANAMLDLYGVEPEERYRAAAIGVADALVRMQQPNGTWYQWIRVEDGSPQKANLIVPTAVIDLFDRIGRELGIDHYRASRDRAFAYCVEVPLQAYLWDAQYEDTLSKEKYRNQSHREAARLAELLFLSGDPGLARAAADLTRFVEDSFVVWSAKDAATRLPWFKPGSRWNGNDPYFGLDWFLPSAVEQYFFFTPISTSSTDVIAMWVTAYRVTGDRLYLAKAVALANTVTITQAYFGGREIPTHLRVVQPELNWLNCSVMAANALFDAAPVLQSYYDEK